MKVLVTGANGFIGANIVHYIIENYPDWDLTCMVHKAREKIPTHVRVIHHDLSKPVSLDGTFDVCIHTAACPSSRECISNPSLGMENITQTFHVLEMCRVLKVPRVIFFSSCEVYGRGHDNLQETDMLASINMYGASKVAGEHMCEAYAHSYDMKCISLRVINTWGPYCQKERFASIVQHAFKTQDCPHFVIETMSRKRWIHVHDVAKKTTGLVCSEWTDAYNAFNIVGDENITLEEFISKFGKNFTCEYKPKKERGYGTGFNANGTKLAHFFDRSRHIIGVQNHPSTNDDISA